MLTFTFQIKYSSCKTLWVLQVVLRRTSKQVMTFYSECLQWPVLFETFRWHFTVFINKYHLMKSESKAIAQWRQKVFLNKFSTVIIFISASEMCIERLLFLSLLLSGELPASLHNAEGNYCKPLRKRQGHTRTLSLTPHMQPSTQLLLHSGVRRWDLINEAPHNNSNLPVVQN